MADLVAWYVLWGYEDDEDAHRAIVFAADEAGARQAASSALGEQTIHGYVDPDEVSVRRRSDCDKYAPGPMTIANYIAEGWSWSCFYAECDHQVDSDGCYYCNDESRPRDDEDEPMQLEPVIEEKRIFCSAAHFDAEAERGRALKERTSKLLGEFAQRWPGATVESYYTGPAPSYTYGVRFHFPGGKYDATWDAHTEQITVNQRDLAAWFDFDQHSKVARP